MLNRAARETSTSRETTGAVTAPASRSRCRSEVTIAQSSSRAAVPQSGDGAALSDAGPEASFPRKQGSQR